MSCRFNIRLYPKLGNPIHGIEGVNVAWKRFELVESIIANLLKNFGCQNFRASKENSKEVSRSGIYSTNNC